MDFDDDTHLCLRCSKTIVGLENYIAHRQQQCLNVKSSDSSIQKPLTNEELGTTCEPSTPPDTANSSQNTPCVVHLTADDFFSSLELQSKTNLSKSTSVESAGEAQRNVHLQKASCPNENELLCTGEETAPTVLLDGDVYDQDVSDDSDNDYYPPTSHTGGKWKPGTRPDLSNHQQWKVVSLPPSPANESEKTTEDHVESQSNVDKLNGSDEPSNVQRETYECHSCNRKLRDKYVFARHQMTSYHKKRSQQTSDPLSKKSDLCEIQCTRNRSSLERRNSFLKQNPNKRSRINMKGSLLVSKQVGESCSCKLCDETFKSDLQYIFHRLSNGHQKNINSVKDWHKSIFEYQETYVKISKFQCLICSFYFNNVSFFLSHMASQKHCQKTAQLKRPLLCIPCDFECRASDEMMNHLTSQHHQKSIPQSANDHPVVITEKGHILCTFCGDKCHLLNDTFSYKYTENEEGDNISKTSFADPEFKTKTKKLPSLSKSARKVKNYIEQQNYLTAPGDKRDITALNKESNLKNNSMCPHCLQHFSSVLERKHHVVKEHKSKCKKCTSCNQFFVTYHDLKRHINQVHEKIASKCLEEDTCVEGHFECNVCSYKSNSKSDFLLHKVKHQIPEQVIEIQKNGHGAAQKIVGKVHQDQKQFIMKKKYKCPFCDKLYPKQHMRFHLYTHTGERPFQCSICNMSFAQRSTLLMHVKRHLGLKHLKCDKCEYKTLRKNDLLRHQQTHSSSRPRPFLCEICGSAQLDQWTLNQHMKRHGDCEYKCTFSTCHLAFTTPSKLAYHLRVHNNDRPFLCDVCGYAGRTAHQLKKHQRSHTGERPFKCKYCSYSASLSSHLLRHMRLHTGSKPYRCPYCDYSCNTQENIRKHILKTKKHLGKKMYPCRYCDFGCNEFQEYKKHLLDTHAEHFPKGEKDIESSVIAGLYIKDCPRQVETPIPYSPRERKTTKKSDSCSKVKKRRTKKITSEPNGSAEPVVYLKIPRVNNLDEIDNIPVDSRTPINHITSNDSGSTTCLATYIPDTVDAAVPVGDFLTETLPDGTYSVTTDVTGTHFLVSSTPDYIERASQLEGQLPDPSGGQHIAHTATVDGPGNTLIVYVPVN